MSNETIKQNAFSLKWEPNGIPSNEMIDGFHSMRGWQKNAFDKLHEKPFMILNAPMGSGKSWLMCLLSAQKMNANSALRTIIAVPQTIIAPGFANAKLRMPNEECINWEIHHNLCKKGSNKGTIKYIIDWLKHDYHTLNDRTLICTHATLVKTYKKLKEENSLHLLRDLLLWIDEAHHVKNVSMEDIEGEVISNGIGDLVRHCLEKTDATVQLGLTTASFFRGDRCSLLTSEMEMQFSDSRFDLPYDEYLKSMKYLKSFSFDFLLCGYEYTNAIGVLVRDRKGKDIIYVPHPKSRHSTGDKYQEVKNIFLEYQKIHGGELIDTADGLNILQSPTQTFKMLDLVDEDKRIEKKEFLNSENLKDQRDALDSIIALGMFKEGANWIWADRSIIVGIRASLVDIVQMMGRLFRDAKDKQHVEVVQLLPFSLDQQNDAFLDNLNNYLKAIYASLILEDVLNPVKLSIPSTKDREKSLSQVESQAIPMSELIPDESTRLSVIDSVISRLASISNSNKEEGKDVPSLYQEYQNTLPEILENYGIREHVEEIGKKIWGMLLRRSLKMQGISVEDIDFNIIKMTHPLEGLLRYTSSACNIDTLAQLREAIRSYEDEKHARWEFNYSLLVSYAQERGHCRTPKEYEVLVDGKTIKLGSWYNDQKKNFLSLPLSKQERLQKLPGFIAKKFRRNKILSLDEWTDLFIKVATRLGTPLIPNSHIEEGFNLGGWMQHIRKHEEWENLTTEQKNRLFSHNFKLSPKTEWGEAATLAMSQFAAREKTTIPKAGHKEEVIHKGVTYLIRLDNLRNRVKKFPSEVEPSVLESLKAIPQFMEELQYGKHNDEEYLQTGLQYYEIFKHRTGQTVIPLGHVEGNFDLSKWNKSIRSRRELEDCFRNKLLQVDPLFFEPHSIRLFSQEIQPRIETFILEHGHALIPQEYICKDGYRLGEKTSDLRDRKTKLPPSILGYLSSLGDKWAWNFFEHLHLQSMQELIRYFEQNGYHKQALPKQIRELKFRVKRALSKYPSSEPLKKRIENLAPGIFDEPKDEQYPALLRYVAREGHSCPPTKHIEDGLKIGYYVSNVRQKYKNGSLSLEERAQYESLDGWQWNIFKTKRSLKEEATIS